LLALVFYDPADYERLKADDRVSLVDLSHLQPRRPVECVIRHVDGTLDRIWLKHSYTSAQLEWFRRGSALNVLVSETEAGPP
jgi:aconitate hydratase